MLKPEPPRHPKFDQNEIVRRIEMVLDLANKGNLTGVAIAFTNAELGSGEVFCVTDATVTELIGAVYRMAHRMHMESHGMK